jgi:hypothetical protein
MLRLDLTRRHPSLRGNNSGEPLFDASYPFVLLRNLLLIWRLRPLQRSGEPSERKDFQVLSNIFPVSLRYISEHENEF